MNTWDVEMRSKNMKVVEKYHERDGTDSEVEYDLFPLVEEKKRCDASELQDVHVWSGRGRQIGTRW
jgi:hypothetical protein